MKRPSLLAAAFLAALALSCQKEPVLELSGQSELSFSSTGGVLNISFTTNRSWTLSSPESWCKVSPASGAASDEPQSARIICDPNALFDGRSCQVTLRADELSVRITVVQSQKNALSVEVDALVADGRAQELTLAALSNVEADVRIPSDASWIAAGATGKGLSQKQIVLSLQENRSGRIREATVYLEKEDVSVPITVKQAPFHAAMDSSSPGVYGLDGADYAYRPGVDQFATGLRNNAGYFRLLDPEHVLVLTVGGIPRQELGLLDSFRMDLLLLTEQDGTLYQSSGTATVIGLSDTLLWLITADGVGVILKRQAL